MQSYKVPNQKEHTGFEIHALDSTSDEGLLPAGFVAITDAEVAAITAANKPAMTSPEAIRKIDSDTDAIYGEVLGSRAEEYALAASEARSYKAAGYAGTVPSSVQSWATAKDWTATQAADDILATAAAWITAQAEIRAARLVRKEQARTALDAAGVVAAIVAWDSFVVAMRGQLGI